TGTREATGEVEALGSDLLRDGPVALRLEDASDERPNTLHLRFLHPASRDGWRSDADPGRDAGLLRVVRDRVLVHRDPDRVERLFGLLAGEVQRTYVDEHEMVVGAPRDDAKSSLREGRGKDARVHPDLPCVRLEFGGRCLL